MIPVPSHAQALIFDLDGTLADTMPLHIEAWIAAGSTFGAVITAEFIHEFAGMPSRKVVGEYNRRFGAKLDPEAVKQAKDAAFWRIREGRIQPIRPVWDLAARYRGILPMAIGTGSNAQSAAYTLAAIGAADWFEAVVSADEVTAHKPAPDTFLACARHLGVAPELCVVYEDADLGMEAARRAGMAAVDVRPYV